MVIEYGGQSTHMSAYMRHDQCPFYECIIEIHAIELKRLVNHVIKYEDF